MANLNVRTTLQVDEHEILVVAERKFVDMNLCFDQCFDVQNAAKTIWDKSAVGSQDGFVLLVLTSDQPLEVEVVSRNGLVERAVNNFSLGKNVPLMISTDSARFDYTSDSFLGQLGELDLVRVNESNDIFASIRLRLWK